MADYSFSLDEQFNFDKVNQINADIDNRITAASNTANAAQTAASTAQTTANNATTTANNAMPQAGGAFTGNVTVPNSTTATGMTRNIRVVTSEPTSFTNGEITLLV